MHLPCFLSYTCIPRSQLQAVHHAPGSARPALHPHNLSYPTPAVLTSDLLQVLMKLSMGLFPTELPYKLVGRAPAWGKLEIAGSNPVQGI